jgi:hypothetical protein
MTTDVIVVSDVETIIVNDEPLNTIVTTEDAIFEVITVGEQGPAGATGASTNLSSAPDLDLSNLQDGSLLIYSQQQQKWVADTQLTNQNLESGHY